MSSNKSYLGVIVDVIDPLKQGRAKVKVFGIFDDLPVEENIEILEENLNSNKE